MKIFKRKSASNNDPDPGPSANGHNSRSTPTRFNPSYARRLSLPTDSLEPSPSSNNVRRRFSIAGARLSRDHVPRQKPSSSSTVNGVFRNAEENNTTTLSEIESEWPTPSSSSSSSDARSVALSDTKTLFHTRQSQMELQETYNENFTLYVPFLFRQWRLAHRNAVNAATGNGRNLAPAQFPDNDDPEIESASPARQEMLSRAARAAREYAMAESDVDDDDISTVIGSIHNTAISVTSSSSSSPSPPSSGPTSMTIMGRSTSRYNNKRVLVIANEFLKHNAFVFVDGDSFKQFKQLRMNIKQDKKTSSVFYDPATQSYKRFPLQNLPSSDSGLIPDLRQHIIGPDYKALGYGLPLFKVQVPYLSSFRKNAPFVVFKRFREVPLPPVYGQKVVVDEGALYADDDMDLNTQTTISKDHQANAQVTESSRRRHSDLGGRKSESESPVSLQDNDYETYDYCTVHVKYFQHCRRYILQFNPENEPLFSVLVFQHNFKPFADFLYKNTRFRVYGTPIVTGYLVNYNPTLKLMIVDPDSPSLVDEIINKKQEFDLKSLIKRKRSSSISENSNSGIAINPVDKRVEGMDNPYPGASNGLIYLDYLSATSHTSSSLVANKLPTFGIFKDVMIYDVEEDNFRIIPKKYTEIGKIETYQELNNSRSTSAQPFQESLSSSKSVDTDTLVLTAVMLTLHEVSIRNSNRQNSLLSNWSLQASNGSTYRYGNVGAFAY